MGRLKKARKNTKRKKVEPKIVKKSKYSKRRRSIPQPLVEEIESPVKKVSRYMKKKQKSKSKSKGSSKQKKTKSLKLKNPKTSKRMIKIEDQS